MRITILAFGPAARARADAYALRSQRKVAEAYAAGKIQPDLVPMAVRSAARSFFVRSIGKT